MLSSDTVFKHVVSQRQGNNAVELASQSAVTCTLEARARPGQVDSPSFWASNFSLSLARYARDQASSLPIKSLKSEQTKTCPGRAKF